MATTSNDTAIRAYGPSRNGTVFFAPKGTQVPTDATTPLTAAFVSVGELSDDGITIDENIDTKELTAFGGHVVRVLRTKYSAKISFEMIETTKETLAAYYGTHNVETTGGEMRARGNNRQHAEQVLVVDFLDGDTPARLTVEHAQIVDRKSLSAKSEEAFKWGVTVAAYPDGNGDNYNLYAAN